nr:efflux transporter outer membrane subunit [Massilia agilis]
MKAKTTVRHLRLTKAAGAVLALALAGCVHVPADTSAAKAPDFAQAQHEAALKLARDAWPAQQWWKEYGDAQLDDLVARALTNGPSIAVAQARVATARAALRAEEAAGGAQVGLNASLNRQRYSATGLFPEPIGGNWFNDSTVQVKASYDFDWWGRHRALVAAALGETSARQAEAAQAAQTLSAAVAQSYFRLQMLWARERNVAAQQAVQRDVLSGRQQRLKQGLVNIDAVQGAEQDLASLNQQAQYFATQAGREREALRALIGADSEGMPKLSFQPPQGVQAALPAQLGIELLARRPDLLAARWRVEAALGRTRAAEAAFYPDLNLMAAAGLNSVSLSRLLQYGSRTMLAGAALNLPIFDAGRLEAGLGEARAQRDELLADYNQSVLVAVRDVAEEAATLSGIAQQRRAYQEAVDKAASLEANARTRLKAGLAESAAVLQAQLATLRLRDAGLQLRDAELQSQVALVKALGGGYRASPIQTAANNQQDNHAIAK